MFVSTKRDFEDWREATINLSSKGNNASEGYGKWLKVYLFQKTRQNMSSQYFQLNRSKILQIPTLQKIRDNKSLLPSNKLKKWELCMKVEKFSAEIQIYS